MYLGHSGMAHFSHHQNKNKKMNSTLLKNKNTYTAFVQLDTYACSACWKCIEVCPNNVIDKSFLFILNTLIHEHVLMYNASECIGCMKCMQACKFNAISIHNQE